MQDVLDWLLEPSQPAIRYLAMRDLLERESLEDLEEVEHMVATKGWVADILSGQKPQGYWCENEDGLYRPKYLSTNWMLLTLSDLGVTRDDPRVETACRLWLDTYSRPDGGFDTPGAEQSEHCVTGNTARALIKFGYAEEPRVKSALDYLVETQKEDGGWHCFGSTGTLDAWEGLSAFAAYPRRKWTRRMKAAVERGCEFYLERRLSKEGSRYEPWFRFHFPYHYYYDILVGLDFLTALGNSGDKRMQPAITHLKAKRRKDGKWNLDAVHPDLNNEGRWPAWWKEHKREFHPFRVEQVGRPSKMITLKALVILKRLGEFEPDTSPSSSTVSNSKK
jgi:hypothetical protein